jgi:hypothetical protein
VGPPAGDSDAMQMRCVVAFEGGVKNA